MNSWRPTILRVWLWHAGVSVLLWVWTMGLLGLGFKDRERWSMFDHLQVALVPSIAFAITMPGRLVFDYSQSWFALVGAWLLNSLLWAFILVAAFRATKLALGRKAK